MDCAEDCGVEESADVIDVEGGEEEEVGQRRTQSRIGWPLRKRSISGLVLLSATPTSTHLILIPLNSSVLNTNAQSFTLSPTNPPSSQPKV